DEVDPAIERRVENRHDVVARHRENAPHAGGGQRANQRVCASALHASIMKVDSASNNTSVNCLKRLSEKRAKSRAPSSTPIRYSGASRSVDWTAVALRIPRAASIARPATEISATYSVRFARVLCK